MYCITLWLFPKAFLSFVYFFSPTKRCVRVKPLQSNLLGGWVTSGSAASLSSVKNRSGRSFLCLRHRNTCFQQPEEKNALGISIQIPSFSPGWCSTAQIVAMAWSNYSISEVPASKTASLAQNASRSDLSIFCPSRSQGRSFSWLTAFNPLDRLRNTFALQQFPLFGRRLENS